MEFKDHAGPVYVLHRVFTLNDVDWPQVDVPEDGQEHVTRDQAQGQGRQQLAG
jgi:hypothetical protein